ncbi:MAG: hypothetical protein V1839_04090 [archaeon]
MIRKVNLHNWKSHTDSEYSFTDGINVIVGNMGAGKSSVLQAISFALFGTFSELKTKDLKISDLVNRRSGVADASVELELENGKEILNIKRVISDGATKEAVIRGSDGRLVAGTNPAQVNAYLKDMLRLDEDLFLRTIYAKQNEIDLFLQLRPTERKTRLDELMGIDKFENARKNCMKLSNQLNTRRESSEEFIRDFNIEDIESEIASMKADCEQLLREKEALLGKISESEKEKGELDSRVRLIRKCIEDFNRLEARKKSLELQSSELREKLGSVQIDEDMQSVGFRLREVKTKIIEIQRTKVNLKEDIEHHQRNALEVEKRLGMLEHKSAELAEALDEIAKLRTDLNELEKEGNLVSLEGKSSSVEEYLRKTRDERSQLIGEVSVVQKSLEELGSTGNVCPVCSSDITPEKKSELMSQRGAKISELNRSVGVLEATAKNLELELENLNRIYERQRDIAKRIENIEDLLRKEREISIQLSQEKGKKETFADIISQMQQRLDDLDLELQNFDLELTQLTEKRHLCELKEKEHEIFAELGEINKKLAANVIVPGELAELEQKFENAISTVQDLKSKSDSYEFIANEKKKRLADFTEKKSRYLEIKDKIKALQDKREFLDQFKNALLAAQETLRKELILAVNEVMAELWTQLYPYDKWTSLRLEASEDDYVLQLKEFEGAWIPVSGFASGGERMLSCLVLRLAFAKVLAQNMSMLILDEPTHNLDDKAISTLVDIIQNRLSDFLDQLFIVTHDEKLAEAGDNIIRIK